MPIYNHECDECGNQEELLYGMSKMDENAVIERPKCGKPTFKRVMSISNFDIIGECYTNSIHGPKGRWRANSELHSKVLNGEANPY